MQTRGKKTLWIVAAGAAVIMAVMVLGTIWMGQSGKRDTENAVRTVSLLYLDELAGRREQVVEGNLERKIQDVKVALSLITKEDLSGLAQLQDYQAWMKQIYTLDKFAFVDTKGTIYTSQGMQDNIGEYRFDYKTLAKAEISILNPESTDKKVVIALPVNIEFEGEKLCVCFMEIDMQVMLSGVSMDASSGGATFCNIYTKDGIALSNTVLGGLSAEDNLLAAMEQAVYEPGYSYDAFYKDFTGGNSGAVSFTYFGIQETLSFVPVRGTDWQLTYLIRESVISDKISSISDGIIKRSIVQSVLTMLVLIVIFILIITQIRRNSRLRLERETAQAEVRGKEVELEQRIALQKKLEEQSRVLSDALMAAQEANKAKTAFLSSMSHEIRTPMNAIIGLDNIALHDPNTTGKTREYLEKIGASAEHLLSLINDILDMSRIESGRMTLRKEEFSFSKLLETINTIFSGQCSEKGLDYRCEIDGPVDSYYIGDTMKLRQVLINILGNAVKFTPEGGKVMLGVKRTAQIDGHSTLRFTITDTGIGMSREFLPHIFDTFSQEDDSTKSRYGSTGLGMAITKNIVEMMNGSIEVESEKGKGSTFTVTIPLMDANRQEEEDGAEEIHAQDMCVLIVDDDPVACEHARLVLEKVGIAAEIAGSGAEAVEMVRLRQARFDPYNLILMDWQMPEMDGVEATRQIRSIVGNESAIIILTAYKWDDVLEEAIQAGVDSFVSKPIFAGTILEEFKSAMKRRGTSAQEKKQTVDLTGRRVLLAEDVQVNAEIMTMVLGMRDMEADVAENGKIAVQKFSEHPQGYYDAILMDLRMPEMDGWEATKAIRSMDREDAAQIPIIALTANAFDEDVQRSMQAGLNAHLSKPVQPEILFETLESLIH